MKTNENLFAEFPETSKEEWLARVERDLKGRRWAELRWQLSEELEVDPFYHPDDHIGPHEPLLRAPANDWEIGELIECRDFRQANEDLLEGLAGGVEAPLLILYREPAIDDLRQLLKGVDLPLISTHFTQLSVDKDPVALLHQFHTLLEEKGVNPAVVRGSIDYDPLLDWSRPPLDALAETLRFCQEKMPGFKILQVNGLRFHSGYENSATELALLLAKGSEYLAQMQERELPAAMVNAHLQLTVAISTSYFVDIAKLRALKILWANLLDAYGATQMPLPLIIGHLARETQADDQHDNMIRAGTQAMAAVIGGVDRLYVRPADFSKKEAGSSFTRRIARNVQHILKMESHLDRVADPGAGSYYIEKLTEKLAGVAWAEFQELEEKGAFRS